MDYTYLQFKETINNIINDYLINKNKKPILDFILSSINNNNKIYIKQIEIRKIKFKKIKFIIRPNSFRYDRGLIIYKKTKLFNLLFSYKLKKMTKDYDLIFILLHRSNNILIKIFKEHMDKTKLHWSHVIFRFIDKDIFIIKENDNDYVERMDR